MNDMPEQPVHPFNIMAKPVCGVCNLDCAYCYYTMKPRELYPDTDKFQMSEEVLESYTRQYLDAQPIRCEFGWQGGEPTLAGLDFFRRAVALQQEHKKPGQTLANALQTNATLIDDEWADFLAEHKFLVGVSLDGPAQWHDHFRRDHAGHPSFHKSWAGLERLRERGVEFNVLVTLNSINAPHAGDIYRYFINRGIQYVQFIPILERTPDGEPTEFSCTGEQFGRFMLDVFELWSSRDVGKVSERFIDAVLHQIIFDAPAMCCYAERCANAHVLEFNGDLYVCDHFVYPEWKIGNIMQRPLTDLVCDPKIEEFARLKSTPPEKCFDCEYFEFCRGGCPKHHRPIGNDPERWNHFCEGYKAFFEAALPELRRMAEYFKRNEMPPPRQEAAVPSFEQTRANAARRAQFDHGPAADAPQPLKVASGRKAPGRNDPCPCGSGQKFKRCCGR